ncbi:VOC family protein [Streptomyces montanisoli]|uniref:VOC family protein n=1 Tax=Streptomyces montanisoli TaxID=2798581 RepID=A0A940MKG6_9ACTN|nr:VOC family protein [Streptomyces montanisoli]MBP0460981.1 VOC family protein [Streptomyces montanisoli]
MTHDLGSAQDFYGAVLGWRFRATALGDEFSVAIAEDGTPAAGIGAIATSLRAAVAWVPYFAVGDADDTAARIRERGATVAVGPLAMTMGRAALAADPHGATFGFWAGMTMPGWAVGRGGAPATLRLRTRDAFAAAIFYGEVFGWTDPAGSAIDVRYERDHVRVEEGGHSVAELYGGALESPPDPHVRPRWEVHFRVRDVSAAVRAAEAAGGAVAVPPAPDTAYGAALVATLRGPDGGLFTVTTA